MDLNVNGDELRDIAMRCADEDANVELIINKFIESKHEKCDSIMSECSARAQQIRDNINQLLETRQSIVSNEEVGVKESHLDSESIYNLQKELESEIKGLNSTLKTAISDDTKANAIHANNSRTNANHDNQVAIASSSVNTANSTISSFSTNTAANVCDNKQIEANINNGNNANNLSRKQSKSISKKAEHKERVSAEQLNKKLANFGDDSQRISFLSNCYIELLEENKCVNQQSKQSDRLNQQLSKEKDQMQCEHNRVVLAKSRLESLCRELQRQNRIIKEESLIKIKEEEEKRREIANKFQGTLNEIMQLIQENQHRNAQLKEENADLAQKLKTLMGHYETWEKHTEQIIKQKDLETQLIKAKYAKTNLILNQEKEIYFKEKQQLIAMISDLQKRCAELSSSELQLRTELSVYTTKYEEFQGVLSKSNDMFAGFKRDMEKMSKQIRKLEKETAIWKSKWETSNKALLVLAEEKQKRDTEHLGALQKIQTLEKLCRALQEERLEMQSQLKQKEVNCLETAVDN